MADCTLIRTKNMIVCYQPGGTIKDARVVLKHNELLPLRYNVPESIVYREAKDNPQEWILVKPKFETLPGDSPLLSQPALPEIDISSLTEKSNDNPFEHTDIIKLEGEK
jgi:hypothetical protein